MLECYNISKFSIFHSTVYILDMLFNTVRTSEASFHVIVCATKRFPELSVSTVTLLFVSCRRCKAASRQLYIEVDASPSHVLTTLFPFLELCGCTTSLTYLPRENSKFETFRTANYFAQLAVYLFIACWHHA